MSIDPAAFSEAHRFAPYWGIHSEKDGQPMLRDWAPSEAEAQARMAEIQRADEDEAMTYWVVQMTEAEADSFKMAGVIPHDA
jgi:hypothetical protein